MEKKFEHKDVEKKIYEMWEKAGVFKANPQKAKKEGMMTMIEDGIFLAALSTCYGMPLIVELGVFFDIFLGVIIMGISVYNIKIFRVKHIPK